MNTTIVEITKICPFCGKVNHLIVDGECYRLWKSGLPIQKAFPAVRNTKREMLISGICEKCQNDVFGGDDDE